MRLAKLAGRVLLTAYFIFALLILGLRYVLLPHVEDYRGDLERLLSSSLELPVAIGHIDAHWNGLNPWLSLHGVQLHDRQHRPALTLDNIEAELSWTSLLFFDLRLKRLELLAPSLNIRRDPDGRITIAGLPVDSHANTQDNALAEWVLAQPRVIIRDARIEWNDQWRNAPPLTLSRLNLLLQNNGRRHRFGLTAEPPEALASRLDLRGDFRGSDPGHLADWQGDAYVALDYADLAIWRQWVDYPVKLSRGSGAVRLWASVARQQTIAMTADIALHDVELQLGKSQPAITLQSLTGRVEGRVRKNGYAASARHLSLRLQDGLHVDPTDFDFDWNDATPKTPATGSFSANRLDFDTLARLAERLPFDVATRRQLADYAPRGLLQDLKVSWSLKPSGNPSADELPVLEKYGIQASFSRLSLNAQGALPGFTGLTGSVRGDEKGGSFRLDSQEAALALPEIFADPRIELGKLEARASWTADQNSIDVHLQEARFENQDAAGVVSGNYTYPHSGQTAGVIDLSARLTRGQGNAVWRYIPIVAGQEVRDWLRTSLIGGHSNDTTLRLKGDLQHFPFDDGSGIFEVKGHVQGANLNYAEGWPQIDNIQGALEFAGKRMTITAERASLYGVALSQVRAEIPDLGATDPQLSISGKASGPTADFLRFIETSPVGEQIGHFTEDMTAQGNGALDLKLLLPLNRLADARIDGRYQFNANRIKVDTELPMLGDVQGRLQFTGDTLTAEGMRATLLGMPLSFDLKTAGNGAVEVKAAGRLNIADLRSQWPHALLDHLSGSATWQGRILARKKNAELLLESRLQGLSSSLPEPFNKSASVAMPLRIERRELPATTTNAAGDQIDITLDNTLAARLIRGRDNTAHGTMRIERGAIAIGTALVLPDKGVLLALNLPRIDLDIWRDLFAASSSTSSGNSDAALPSLPLTGLAFKTPLLTAFGYSVADLDARARLKNDDTWNIDLKSRDISGELSWRGRDRGRLTAHLKQLSLHRDKPAEAATPAARETADNPSASRVEKLPGLDIDVERFILQGKDLGRLKLSADQRNTAWEASLDIDNPDARLTGSGRWRPGMSQPDTQLKFSLATKNIEKLLLRLGYADALKRGSASLEGQLTWAGLPYIIDYPTLAGDLRLHAEGGQFNKLEPGMGRLLGILSLQSLPRRITLDFRDVFSQGFAFDSIDGQLALSQGVISTQDLKIQGPAAKVLMSGNANVPQETQNLKVRVQPAIGESLAVGTMIANPAAGALAWLAQKVMRDPLDQAFAFEYAVTGRWDDPRVEKIGATPTPTPQATPQAEQQSPRTPRAPLVENKE